MPTSIERPLVAVCGATGTQGSSVVHHLLRDGGYRVRVLAQNIDSEKAQVLKRQGAEAVQCDLGNMEQVIAALDGAHAVFGLTNFWEHGEEGEVKHGKNLADAAKACGVKHFIWSACPIIDDEVPRHWASKARVEKYLHEIGVPTTTLLPTFYFQNLLSFFHLKKSSEGSLVLDWFFPSDTRVPSFSVEDLGAWVVAALKDPQTWIGKQIKICTEILTPREYAVKLSSALGTNVELKEVDFLGFEAVKPHVPIDAWLNFKAYWANPDLMEDAVGPCRQLFPGAQDLEGFAKSNKDELLAAATST